MGHRHPPGICRFGVHQNDVVVIINGDDLVVSRPALSTGAPPNGNGLEQQINEIRINDGRRSMK